MKRILENIGRYQDVAFVVFFGVIVALLIIPLPTIIIDSLIGLNMAVAVTIIVTSLYLRNVLDLSTFPAIVLLTTLFRLALSVATTRLILAEGDAGHIITAFGNFVVEGNVIVGLVIFFIVAIVQFIVVTKGAERIAEVTARFTLDAMPGKQMAIDADVRAGGITAEEAQTRRFKLEKEAQFFGSMDGAMRFVKGDAIAGLIIIAVNLIGGMLVGMLQKGMSAGEAFGKYSLLTIGDGLVAQIPSMFIAVAAGIVVTRVVKEDAKDVGRDITAQLGQQARPLGIAAVFCVALGFVPGFPTTVFFTLAALLGLSSYFIHRRNGGSVPFAKKQVGSQSADYNADGKQLFIEPGPAPVLLLCGPVDLKKELENSNFARNLNDAFVAENIHQGFPMILPGFAIDNSRQTLTFNVEGREALNISRKDAADNATLLKRVMRETRFNAWRTFDVEMAAFWQKDLAKQFTRMTAEIEKSTTVMVFADVVRRLAMHGVSLRQPRPFFEALMRADEVGRSAFGIAGLARRALASLTQIDVRQIPGRAKLILFTKATENDLAAFAFQDAGRMDIRACESSVIGKKLIELRNTINGAANVIVLSDLRYSFGLQYFMHERQIKAWALLAEEVPEDIKADVLYAFTDAPSTQMNDLASFRRNDRPPVFQ